MHRRPIVIANWKMHTTLAEALILGRAVNRLAEQIDDCDIVLLPPTIWLPSLISDLQHRPKTLQFGVQNFYPEREGAYTGETGLEMLTHFARYTLIGHSERRQLFDESLELIHRKVVASLTHGFWPILCVGELTPVMLKRRGRGRPTVIERESNLIKQLQTALASLTDRHIERLTVCYEPLWAIGTGQNVPGPHAAEVVRQLRQVVRSHFGQLASERIRMIYGGSVTEKTIHEYVAQPDIDGVLVGGASLSLEDFRPIVTAVAQGPHASFADLEK